MGDPPIELLPWQAKMIRDIRHAIPRKNGKSRFAGWKSKHWSTIPMTDPTFADEIAKHSAPVVLPASELARLRKIESAARQIDDWLHDNPATESRISMVGRILLTDLRKALETETDG